MKIGYFANVTGPGRRNEFPQVLQEVREQALLCEEAGFHSIWFTEHHFGHEGFELISNPLLMGADIAARTERIRIGQAANIITYWHPLRLAEDIALLDQLSGGRVEIGLGRGVYGREQVNLNQAAQLENEEQNRALFEETFDILKKAFSSEFFAHQGDFYTIPFPNTKWKHPLSPPSDAFMNADGTIAKLGLVPRPVQQPFPPFWQVIDSPRSIQWAAQHQVNGIFWMPTIRELAKRFGLYQRLSSEASGREVPLGEGLALVRDVYVADTMDQAREEAGQAVTDYYKWVCHWRGLGNLMNPGEAVTPEMTLSYEFLHPRNLLFGTPAYVIDKIRELKSELNLQYLLLFSTFPGLSHANVMKSLKLFQTQVLPHVVD